MSRTLATSAKRRPPVAKLARTVASSAGVPDGLDWQAYCAAYFPGRRRHDLEALTSYGAYRRSRVVDEPLADEVATMAGAKNGPAGSSALQDWEGEGGAAT